MTPVPWRCGYCRRTAQRCRRRGASPVCDGCREHLAARGKRFCRECRQAKPLGHFDRIAGPGVEQRRAVCKACRRPQIREQRSAYMRGWRQRNRAHVTAYRGRVAREQPDRERRYRRTAYLNWKVRQSQELARKRAGPAA